MQPGMTVSAVARLHDVSPSLLFQWSRRMAEGGHEAVRADAEVVPVSRLRELENRIRALARLLGRKTMETEILREALEQARPKNKRCACRRRHATVPGEGRGRHPWRRQVHNLVQQLRHPERPRRGPYRRAITDARPTYGYRRVTALLNRAMRSSGEPRSITRASSG